MALGPAGRKLRAELDAEFEFGPDESAVIDMAAGTADSIAQIERLIRSDGPSRDLLSELRLQRGALVDLLRRCNLLDVAATGRTADGKFGSASGPAGERVSAASRRAGQASWASRSRPAGA